MFKSSFNANNSWQIWFSKRDHSNGDLIDMTMVKIDYLCELFENQLPHLYTLLQGDVSDVFYVCIGDQLIGTINKVTDGWEQIGGRQMSEEFIDNVGKFIEDSFEEPAYAMN